MVNGNSPTSQHGSTAENGTPWDWVTNLEKQVMDDNNVGPSRPSTTVLANLTPLATVEAILGIGGYNRWLDAMSVFRTSNGKELGTDVNGFLMDHALSVMKDSEAESRLSCSRTQLSDYEFKEGLMHSVRATGLGLVGQLLLLSTVLSPALAQTVKDTMIDLAEADEAAYLWLEKEENIQVDRSNCVRWLSFVKKACDAVQLEWTRVVHEDITVSDALQHYSGLRWTKLCTLDQLILKEREAFHYLSRAGDEGVKLGDQARLDVLNRCLPESNRWGYVLTPELNKILRSARSVPEWVSVAKQIRSDSRRSGLLPDREYQPTKSESSTYASYKVETQSRRRGKKAAKDEDKVQEAVKRRLNKARGNKKNKQHVRNSRPLRGSRGAVSGSEDDTEATIVCYHCHGIGHRRPQCPHRETDKAEARRLVKSDTKVPTSSDKSGGTKGPTIRTLRSRRAAAARAPVDYKKVPEHRVHATQTIDNGNGVGSGELDGSSNEHGSDHDPHDEPTGGELAESLASSDSSDYYSESEDSVHEVLRALRTGVTQARVQRIHSSSCGMDQVVTDTSRLLWVSLTVDSRVMDVYVDTCATVSYIGMECLDSSQKGRIQPCRERCKGIGGYESSVQGLLKLRCRTVSKTFCVWARVIAGQSPLLLGLDSLHKIGLHLHLVDGQVRLELGGSDSPGKWVGKVLRTFSTDSLPELELNVTRENPPLTAGYIPMRQEALDAGNKILDDLVKRGVVEDIDLQAHYLTGPEPWVSNGFAIPKGTDKWRFIVDLRKVNLRLDHSDCNEVGPDVVSLLSSIPSKAEYFGSIDLRDAFFNVRLVESSKRFLITRFGHHHVRWNRAPQGLALSPTFWNSWITALLRRGGIDTRGVRVYVDDLIIFGHSEDEVNQKIQELLSFFRNCGVAVSMEKVVMAGRRLVALGMELTPEGWSVSQAKLDKLKEMTEDKPTTRDGLRSLIGMLQYCRTAYHYIRKPSEFSEDMGALNDLLKGSGRLKWTPESDAAYDRLRRRFEQRYLPFYSVEETSPGPSRRYVVQADASDVAIGFCLWSIDVSKEVSADSLAQSGSLLMWGSKVLNSASRSWPSWDREGYAVYVALCRFRPWLISSMTTAYVLTDNTGCLYKWATMEKSERLLPSLQRGQRWLRWFNMTSDLLVFKSICFKHVKGVENGLADALSRLTNHLLNRDEEAVQTDRCLQTAVGSGEPGNGFLGDCEWAPPPLVGPIQEACREAQPQDGTTKFLGKTISEIYQLVANKGDPNTTTPDWLDRFILFDHCLMMNSLEPVTHLPRWLVVVPAGTIRVDIEGETKSVLIREYLCWLVHSRVATGHPSPAMMKCLLRQHCWWPSMEVCCRTWTSKCHTCQVESARTNRNLGKFSLRRYPGRFEAISVDYTGPYEVSSVGQYRFSLTIMDLCTGYVRFAATRTRCGGEFVATLLKSWGMDFDLPRTILHDRDGAFTAEVVRAWKARSQIEEKTSLPYLARMNGKCERAHQEMKRCVRQVVAQSGSASWPEALSVAARVHNRTPTFREKISPYQLVFGQLPRDDWGNLVNGLRHEEGFQKLCEGDPSGFLQELKANIDSTLTIYRENNVFHRLGMNHYRRESTFRVGDRVLYLKHAATDGPVSAFHQTVEGPYSITDVSERQPALITLDGRIKCAADQVVRYQDYDSVLPTSTPSVVAQEVVELERVDPESISVGDFLVYRSPGNDWLFEIARVSAVSLDEGVVDVDLFPVNRSEKWLASGRGCRVPVALVLCKIEMNNKARITRRSRQDLKNLGIHI